MKILIFGATGGTGRQLLQQGLDQGHHITAFVRNPTKLTIKNKNLVLVKGNILNEKDVSSAMKGQEVIISVLGNKTSSALRESNTIISESIGIIISQIKANNVMRLLFVASFGVNEKIFLPEKLFIRLVLKNIFADIPKQEELIKKSGLDWTIVHPARLVNAPKTEKYEADEQLPIGLFSKIARSDVADFLLKNVDSKKYYRKIITISY
jgi:putative NADH-flavin reductase